MKWKRGKPLGHGSFATVSLAIPKNSEAQLPLMAVKTSQLINSSTLKNEKQVLDNLKNCPQIIQCFGENHTTESNTELYNIMLEYAPFGSLAHHVKNSGGKLHVHEVKKHARTILKGLSYIHQNGFVHCDIKLQNILVFEENIVKIADFGLAKKAGQVDELRVRGTPLYMSPESVSGGECEFPADIWALGCAVVEMVTGAPPWRGGDVAEVMMKIGGGGAIPEIPEELCDEGKDFLEKCFVKDQSERWTAEMLLEHPFVCGGDVMEGRDLSPRDVFEFPDWEIEGNMSSYSPSDSENGMELFDRRAVEDRLELLDFGGEGNWLVSSSWIDVRR